MIWMVVGSQRTALSADDEIGNGIKIAKDEIK